MAHIFQDSRQKEQHGSKAPWFVEWYENGNRRSMKVGSKADAEKVRKIKDAEQVQRLVGGVVEKLWPEFVREYEQTILPQMRSIKSRESARTVLKTFGEVMRPKFVTWIDKRTLDEFASKRLKMEGRRKGDHVSPETVRKELRTIRAALAVAVSWGFLRHCPPSPKIDGFGMEKRFVTPEHFTAMLDVLDQNPAVVRHPADLMGIEPAQFWRAILLYLFLTGQRIGATLELRWDDVNLDQRIAWSRARHNKQKKDQPIVLGPVVDELRRIRTLRDPRVFPWNMARTLLDRQFHDIQRAAGIHLPCSATHEHTPSCFCYGFHDFRRAHATLNYGRVSDQELQSQMGHSSFETTKRYIQFAQQHSQKDYNAFVPEGVLKPVSFGA